MLGVGEYLLDFPDGKTGSLGYAPLRRKEKPVIKDAGDVPFVIIFADRDLKRDVLRVEVISVSVRVAPHFAKLSSFLDVSYVGFSITGIKCDTDS